MSEIVFVPWSLSPKVDAAKIWFINACKRMDGCIGIRNRQNMCYANWLEMFTTFAPEFSTMWTLWHVTNHPQRNSAMLTEVCACACMIMNRPFNCLVSLVQFAIFHNFFYRSWLGDCKRVGLQMFSKHGSHLDKLRHGEPVRWDASPLVFLRLWPFSPWFRCCCCLESIGSQDPRRSPKVGQHHRLPSKLFHNGPGSRQISPIEKAWDPNEIKLSQFFLPPEWKWTFNDIYDATYGFRGFNGQLDSTPCLAATSSAFEARFRLERILGGPSIPAALRNSLVSRPNFPQTMHIKLSHIQIIKNATWFPKIEFVFEDKTARSVACSSSSGVEFVPLISRIVYFTHGYRSVGEFVRKHLVQTGYLHRDCCLYPQFCFSPISAFLFLRSWCWCWHSTFILQILVSRVFLLMDALANRIPILVATTLWLSHAVVDYISSFCY